MPVEAANKLHVVLVTLGAQGHLNPFISLAKKLARLGVSVTILLPSKLFVKFAADTEALDIKIASLTVPTMNSPPPRITMKGIRRTPNFFSDFEFPAPAAALKQALQDMVHDPTCVTPAAVIHDSLLYWAAAPIDELGLPRYVLNTPATSHLAVGLYIHANPNKKSGESVRQEAEKLGALQVPGLPSIPWDNVGVEHRLETDKFFLGEKNARETLLGSKGILLNSCHALEGRIIASLQASYPENTFLPAGPLVTNMHTSNFYPKDESPCINWLNKQQPGSVVYISFGSWASIGEEQIKELALGLEISGKSFLWVLPASGEGNVEDVLDELLPEGFRERMRGRGFICPEWAPQQLILDHVSVGGFVTHCGWNSVVENMSLRGVPMLAWPFVADQPITCRFLVEVLQVAVDIHENSEGVADRNEVCRALRALDDPKLRERAAQLRKNQVTEEDDDMKSFVKRL